MRTVNKFVTKFSIMLTLLLCFREAIITQAAESQLVSASGNKSEDGKWDNGGGKTSYSGENFGVFLVLDPSVGKEAYEEYLAKHHIAVPASREKSDLVMANVQNTLNVREDASEEAKKVGYLYKDCGGRILERKDGWTKLKSGDVIGWASDEFLLFDEEAETMANDVGNLIVTIETDALRVRKEPGTESGILGLVAADDELDVMEQVSDDWISVDYDGEIGYVSTDFVKLDFHIDVGETVEAVRAREKAEAEAKRKARLTLQQGAVVADADDTRLLAALIQCEAGREVYEGQLAVAAVVMNRVRSGGYPNTISGVIYASGQFPPALNGKVARTYQGNVKDSCMQAATEALAGNTNVGTATHFRRAGSRDGIVIGNHVFW